ncbi:hypothetical protein DFH11DRAFT_1494555, partial [Phellopilus nigrolimitatus]
FNLAWKLALVVKGHASPSLLDSYEGERIPVISEMLKITTNLFNRVFRIETQQALARTQTSAASGPDDHMFSRDRKLFQLDFNYRWSTIVRDER